MKKKNVSANPLKGYRLMQTMEMNGEIYEIYIHSKNGSIAFGQNGTWISDPDLQDFLMSELMERNKI